MKGKFITAAIIGFFLAFLLYNSFVLFPKEKAFKSVSPEEFYKLMQNEEAFVIDVHVPEQKHLNGTDAWIPYNKIEEFADILPKDKNTPILVYCRSGQMSKIAASKLAQMGYKNIYELDGGILAWQRANLPY
ncbi:rhodanese-like domain-containing protein [Ferroglobus sp.]|uniref:rhodanese-like domain-containing protein n=1 Tax=Ferroglobus sp. TaxID=2614230 RepID=UPI0025C6FE8C|nr:rhodanese-like domain-containing protein [Ferroglobus sp.]